MTIKKFSDRTKRGVKPKKDRHLVRSNLVTFRVNEYEHAQILAYIKKHHSTGCIGTVLREIILQKTKA